KDQMAARKLIPLRARPNLARLADDSVPLKDTVAWSGGRRRRRSPAREQLFESAARVIAHDARHELATEFAIAVELQFSVELVGRRLVWELRVRAPVAVDISAQVSA